MPSTTIRAKGSHASPRPGVPMSERQQMALLMQMTSNEQLGFENELHPSTSGGAVALKSPSGPSGPSPRRRRNERGETPLHVAAIKGDETQVRRLIAERGADPNAKDFAGWTPLHEACNKGWYGVASALLEAGASVNARGYDDITPLHDAAVNGHAKLVRLLVSSGADVTQRNRRGKTPGDEAAPGLDKTLFRDAVFDNAENSATDVASFRSPPDAQRPDVLSTNSTAVPTNHEQVSGAPCEMRKAPLQHKGDSKSGSTRVTLRLHQLKPRDEKRRSSSSANAVNYYSESMEGKTPDTAAESKVKEEPSPVVPEADKPTTEKTAADDNAAIPEKEKTPEPPATAKKPGPEPGTVGAKRSLTESMEGAEEGDEESKKKKRRDSDAGKDVTRNGSARPVNSAKNTSSTDKSTKPAATTKAAAAVVPPKVAALGTPGTGDRKSPVGSQSSGASPKPATKLGEAEEEGEEMPLAKSATGGEGGPKVPPLKIVIPQQSAALEQEQGVRNGKNGKTHQALPYVVASSSSNDSVPDKDGAPGSAAPSPPDCGAAGSAGGKPGGEEKKDSLASLTAEERSTHQRVLRSSHRSGGSSSSSSSGGQPPGGSAANLPGGNNAGSNASSPQPGSSNNSVGDRNSNNSSPHLSISQRQSPSPDVVPPPPEAPPTAAAVAKAVCVTPPAVEQAKMEVVEPVAAVPAPTTAQLPSVELHPRKRKLKQSKEPQPAQVASTSAIEPVDTSSDKPEVHPHEQPITNCYQLFLDIRKQIERRRKGLFPVQPKPPSGFKDYLMNRCTYVLAGNSSSRLSIPNVTPPQSLQGNMKELFADQEKERYRLRMQHVIEKEKLVLSVEQEILRVHGRAARALANQSLPFSVCTILKDEEVYNVITPEQEEKDRNARSRYNGRLFISWLQDVDDKWEKIKESMLLRHHNEAESLHAVQKMDWEWKMKELGICEFKAKPVIEDLHVPMVHVSDDFDLLPA